MKSSHTVVTGCAQPLATILVAVFVGVPGSAVAQNVASIPEIIVTTERREASLQEVPVAVSALDANTLKNRQIISSQDLGSFVPNLKLTASIGSPTNLSPALRGSTQTDSSLFVAESPFGIYVDDVYIARLNGNNIAMNDLERVEVLRGPQGTLYGRNTLQGAIRFITRTPGEDSWLNASLGGGSDGQYLASASAGGPLGSSNFSGSISGVYNHTDGWSNNAITGKDTGEQRNEAFRGKLRYRGIEKADFVLSLAYSDSKNDSQQLIPATTPGVDDVSQYTSDDLVPTLGRYSVGTPTFANPAPPPITADPEGETKQTIVSLKASYDFDAFTVQSVTGYVNSKDFYSTDMSGTGRIVGATDMDTDTFSEELQIQGTAFNDRLNYVGGLYYFHDKGDQDFGWYYLIPVSTSQLRAKTDSYAVFGQIDYKITERLNATLGARWVRDEKTYQIDQQLTASVLAFPPFASLIDPAFNQVKLKNNYTETTPKLGLDYTFEPFGDIDSLMIYTSIAQGFKSGGYNGIAIFNLNDASHAYGPETNTTYEGGLKAEAFNRRIRVNAAYFWADISDLVSNATVGVSFPSTNVGDASVHGLELELTAAPTSNLTIFSNASFGHGSYGNLDPTSAPAMAQVKWGVHPRLPLMPKYAFTLGFDYGLPIPLGSIDGKLRFGMDWFTTADYVHNATIDFVNKSYDRVNAFVGLDIGQNWDVRLAVKNLADDYYIIQGSRATTASVGGPAGLGGFIPLPPREVLFTVNYHR